MELKFGSAQIPQTVMCVTHKFTRVARELTQPFLNKHHHVFCDNFFKSIPLACDLLRDKTYLCGTIRSNRRGFPSSWSPQKAEVKALQKGESKFCCHGNLVASV